MSRETPFEKYAYDVENRRKSAAWFNAQARLLKEETRYDRLPPSRILKSIGEAVTKILDGRMYMFVYDPETKKRLPYYDKFPLVIPWEIYSEGMIGINLHFLHPKFRLQLLKEISDRTSKKLLKSANRGKISYRLVGNFEKMIPQIKHSIRKYKFKNMRSKMKSVNYEDWTTAVMLPTERIVRRNA